PVLTGALTGSISPLPSGRPDVADGQFCLPLTCLGVLWAAPPQRLDTAPPNPRPRRPRRRLGPFSVVPYLSVCAVDVLLLITSRNSDPTGRVVAVGTVVLTVLVVVRQVVAFQENARLLTEVDAQQSRFRSLVQNSSDVIVILDTEGRVGYASPGLHQILGSDPADWTGTVAATHVHPDDRPAVEEVFTSLLAEPNATVGCQARLSHVDG